MTLRARVEINENLTYGDLFDFVDIVRDSDVSPDTLVKQIRADHHGEDLGLEAFEADVTLPQVRSVVLHGYEVRQLLGTLEEIIDSEGDARSALSTLTRLRKRLIGLDD
ncbi:hypothetical protein KIF24_16685 [Micromonospora sp. Llam7]|uniref:hypothetical protein n=1 Tax=Micromonospora tarapacensis TaxID=2835305 RepID=UPI001C8310D1|nr:hypothetical protein [Micromonospora tarapacensis]MBX7267502.1 hypothetical protein [Micromonospora tarapacensis]